MNMTSPALSKTVGFIPAKIEQRALSRFWNEDLPAAIQSTRMDMSNFHLVHHRHVDGILASAKNSGTHWLKFMLSHSIAHHFSVEPPAHSSGPAWDDIIGNPRIPPRYDHLPRITSTHTIPSRLITLPIARQITRIPPVVVLVRDIRDALASNYVKWHGFGRHGDTSFSQFVRGDVRGKRYVADTWWYMRFHNHWGDIASVFPSRTLVVRYEDLQRNPREMLRAVAGHFGIALSEQSLAAGLKVVDKQSIRASLDPDEKRVIVRDQAESVVAKFSPESRKILRSILGRHLRYDYGYDYF